jgi:hypothetical protein
MTWRPSPAFRSASFAASTSASSAQSSSTSLARERQLRIAGADQVHALALRLLGPGVDRVALGLALGGQRLLVPAPQLGGSQIGAVEVALNPVQLGLDPVERGFVVTQQGGGTLAGQLGQSLAGARPAASARSAAAASSAEVVRLVPLRSQ